MKRALVIVFASACGASATLPPSPPPSPLPVAPSEPLFDPPAPTLRLPTNFQPARYTARLAIDPAQPTFTGAIEIAGTVDRRSAAIWLHAQHLRVHAATATRDGAATATALIATPHGEDLLELRAAQPLAAGHYVVALTYDGTIQPVGADAGAFLSVYGADKYLTTQFEATSARLVFPCVDEPGSKVPWQLTLEVPKDQLAVSNTPSVRETPLDATHVRVEFAPTRPLPSYLVAFGVGPFEIVDAGHAASGTPLRVIVPRGQRARGAYLAATLPKIVDALAAWTDLPFPYPKLDVVARDSGGAMENAGLIMADASYMLADGNPPPPSVRHRMIASAIGHETAHQWFGDLVTAAWWDDIWLNEAFATFMEAKVGLAIDPSWGDADARLPQRFGAARADSLTTARQIRQPITSDADIHNMFDAVTYAKGDSVLSMFEAALGPEVFQRGLRAYLRAHADRTATVGDVVSALETASGKPLAAAFASFLDQPGVPELDTVVTCAAGKPARATLSQHRYVAPGGTVPPAQPRWQLPVCIAYETPAHARQQVCAELAAPTLDVELPGSACPAWVWPDADAHAYARFAVTEPQAVALRDHAWPLLTVAERRLVYTSVLVRALDGKLPVAVLASFIPKLLAGGREEIGEALGDAQGEGNASALFGPLKDYVPASLVPAVRARMRAAIAPIVKRLGTAPRATDTFDDEIERLDMLATASWAQEPVVARDAVALAAHYRDLSRRQREVMLPIAASASPAVAAKLRSDALAESSPELRADLLGALGGIRDPDRLRAMLDLALEPTLRPRDVVTLLTSYDDETGRAVVEAWLRAHLAAVQRALPTVASEDFPPLLYLESVFSEACDPARRDEVAAYMTATFGALASGARPTKNSIERMDQCIAKRALVEPSLRAWLGAH